MSAEALRLTLLKLFHASAPVSKRNDRCDPMGGHSAFRFSLPYSQRPTDSLQKSQRRRQLQKAMDEARNVLLTLPQESHRSQKPGRDLPLLCALFVVVHLLPIQLMIIQALEEERVGFSYLLPDNLSWSSCRTISVAVFRQLSGVLFPGPSCPTKAFGEHAVRLGRLMSAANYDRPEHS